ncbi:hypothetical protein ABEF95_013413 [Exophiala dermatitidis]
MTPSKGEEAEAAERLEAELSLLQAMYPGSLSYDPKSREVHYTSSTSTSTYTLTTTHTTAKSTLKTASPSSSAPTLTLRLPDTYPIKGAPEVIAARDGAKNDIRDGTKKTLEESGLLPSGSVSAAEESGEVIDQIIEVFESVAAAAVPNGDGDGGRESNAHSETKTNTTDDGFDVHVQDADMSTDIAEVRGAHPQPDLRSPTKTVIIWLHHLLALSKRKLAVTPSTTAHTHTTTGTLSSSSSVSGISGLTKPGYPGIMIFSGPRDLVDAHVAQLRALNWQAFQVRYDSDEDEIIVSGTGGQSSRAGKVEPVPGRNDNDNDKQKQTNMRKQKQKQKHSHTQHKSGEKPATQGVAGSGSEWHFSHGQGKIVEVGTMAEVVKAIVDEDKKEIFLRAVGVK